jgi:hypothetical protein
VCCFRCAFRQEDEEESSDSSGELLRLDEREFLERAGEELDKVSSFYATKEAELLARGDALIHQLRILADVKRILADHAACRRGRPSLTRFMPATAPLPPAISGSGRFLLSASGLASPQSTSGWCTRTCVVPFVPAVGVN